MRAVTREDAAMVKGPVAPFILDILPEAVPPGISATCGDDDDPPDLLISVVATVVGTLKIETDDQGCDATVGALKA